VRAKEAAMYAVGFHRHGGPEVLEPLELETPEPGAGEVRVRVAACGLNHLDLWVRGGLPGLKLPMPHVGGGDIAGHVDAVGRDVRHVKAGDRVVLNPGVSCGVCARCLAGEDNLCPKYGIFGEHRRGGNAEYVVAPAANVVPLPGDVSFEDAACLPVTFVTAWQMVAHKAGLRPGDVALVQAASSGVGVALVQMARLFGATVIATASTEAKRARLPDLGAAHVLDSTDADLPKAVKALTGGQGVDVVFDHVGIATWERSVRSLRYGGRLVTCGATTGYDARVDLRVLFWKQIQLIGSTMGSKADFIAALGHVAAGRLRAVRDVVLPLERLREAHERLEAREQFGKIVVAPPA
jgi:NADPH:quinone reductase-like Zn-dependent oxidoreductase